MKKVGRTIYFDEDAAALLLQLAGGPRKQGTYLSDLIRQAARAQVVDARLAALEAELAHLKTLLADRAPGEEETNG